MWNALSRLEAPTLVGSNRADLSAVVAPSSAGEEALAVSGARITAATALNRAAVTTERSGARGEPTTQAEGAKCGGTLAEWEAFLVCQLDNAFYRGAALLPGFPVLRRELRTTPHVVDVDLWNSYWSAFSDRFAAHIDNVQACLRGHAGEGEQRRVLVAASLADESSIELFKNDLAAHAHSFGALEQVSRERCVVMLQFTSPCAAEIFAAWASSLTLKDFFSAPDPSEQASSHCRLLVRLISHDAGMITSTLELGSNIVLSTPFVESLFKGVFDAVSVTYHEGLFLVAFASVLAAKTVLHSLQRSLLEVFGLSLTFSEHLAGHCETRLLTERSGRESSS
ncbi:hypothetical protein TraAM80_04935 [Trypanosoma rangeli]|uniref:Uncharacterized protein n=1 Tax=Trypanosoma rangeli TaxID=5698 RepID=A0A3R7KE13_TRYRA|nr:uncharacterized protein TraAM80_04935 [Trypanosoma rangeli]RNF04640.1 hypothetical protein TraAM80_04935 [Trypanosoma rangeli]|eukprot:RNF04640.1 hypothetical protein TraAM80_04935 [Trypanosoma rangeli]